MKKAEIANIFKSCKTVEAVKAAYIQSYPAIRSNQIADFYAQYEKAYKRCGNCHADASGKTYKGATIMPARLFGSLSGAVYDCCKGVTLTLSGQMLIASGNTKPNRETLRSLGFYWDKTVWKYKTVNAEFLARTMPITNAALATLAE